MKISMILHNLGVVFAFLVGMNLVVCQETTTDSEVTQETSEPVQSGPLIDLLGTKLESLQIEGQSAQVMEHYTNEALSGKKVVGLYFSADWYVLIILCFLCICALL
jgi:hypothetical protein